MACADGYNSRNFPTSGTYSNTGAAIQWSITPDPGYTVTIQSISTSQKRIASGPSKIRFAYSTDGTTWITSGIDNIVNTASCGSSFSLSWNMADFTHTSTVYFRVYAFNAASSAGQHQILNINTFGTVDPVTVLGCTDPVACNYDPLANTDDGSCVFGGCTDPAACNYDASAACDDGSCILIGDSCDDGDPYTSGDTVQPDCNCLGTPDNDDRSLAIPIALDQRGQCNPLVTTLQFATPSVESNSTAITGEDVWYTFEAVTNAVQFEVLSYYFDGMIELQDVSGTTLDTENIRAGAGNEIFNFDGLTEGDTYYVAIRNYDSGSGNGFIDMCFTYVRDSYIENIPPMYNPCDNAKSRFVGAYSTTYTFTSQTTLVTTTYTVVGSTYFQPRNVPGMTWDDTFDVDVDPLYHLTDAMGNMEVINVTTDDNSVMVMAPQLLMQLRAQDQCGDGPNPRGSIVAGEPFVCMSVDYEWEFTRTDVPTAPFYHFRGMSNRFLVLATVTGLQYNATYDVRVRPIFSYGPGEWGSTTCMSIAGPPSMMLEEPTDKLEQQIVFKEVEAFINTDMDFTLYPNPNSGDNINIILDGVDFEEMITISVFDMSGKLMHESSMNSTTVNGSTLEFENSLAAGMYTVRIAGKDFSDTQLMVVSSSK